MIFSYSRHILSRSFLSQEYSMSEPSSTYLSSLRRLITHLKSSQHDHDYQAALVFEQRLTENFYKAELHGDTEQLRHDRSEIIKHLNQITERTHHMSFLEYCNSLTNQPPQPVRPLKPGLLLSANDYIFPL